MAVEIRDRQRKVKADLRRLHKDTEQLLKELSLSDVEVSILLTNDSRIRLLNRLYRGKDKSTDVLSFPMDDEPHVPGHGQEVLLGDIVINLHMASRIASDNKEKLHDVIRQLLIHGLLHLTGLDHEKGPAQEKAMIASERKLINALKKMDK